MSSSRFLDAKRMITTAIQLFSDEAKLEAASFDFPWSQAATDVCDDIVQLSELREAVRTMKFLQTILQSMLTSASDVLTRLNARFTDAVNKTKFSAIPDDIMAHIFEMANQDSDGHTNDVGVRLSLVSRRFNRIATNLPLLWSTISFPRQSIELVKQFVPRAGTPCIHLTIEQNYRNSTLKSQRVLGMYQIMTSISSRIRSLSLSLGSYDIAYLPQILNSCSSLSLPSLVELKLECDRQTGRICRPSIRDLELIEIIPEFRPDVLKQIDDCFVKLNEMDIRDNTMDCWRSPEITALLLSLTSVAYLRVSIRLPRGRPPDRHKTLSMPSVKFPEIESFELHLELADLTQLGDAIDAVKASLGRFTKEEGAVVKDLVLVVEQVSEFFEKHDAPFGRIARWVATEKLRLCLIILK
ncbi:hypothetical protein SCHPADRAFT_998718 [Schizopora paradoxa]|uniref:F-box domain-containing protein n=1 Tax=Schizopora paradoxa TaxID=27342 RepID=A0A0H2S3W1_9AGAM|nr:hypothetical protein SCHPADRAFT_998718 [Schizopora paradoxa]